MSEILHLTKDNPFPKTESGDLPPGLTLRQQAEEEAARDLAKEYKQLLADAHEELLNPDRPPDQNLLHAQKRIMSLTARAAMSHDTASNDLINSARSIHEVTTNLIAVAESTRQATTELVKAAVSTDKASQSIVNLNRWLIGYTIVLIVLTAAIIFQGCQDHRAASKPPAITSLPAPATPQTPLSVTPVPVESINSVDVGKILADVKRHFPTVTQTYAYTAGSDPNGNLGKPGYYTAGGAFMDKRAHYTGSTELGQWGAEAGGSVEVYGSYTDAAKRATYLAAFQGNPLTEPGAFKQVGNVIIRASEHLTKGQQDSVLAFLVREVH